MAVLKTTTTPAEPVATTGGLKVQTAEAHDYEAKSA